MCSFGINLRAFSPKRRFFMKITGTIVAIIKQNCILHLFNEKMDENLVDFGCEILNWGLF
jgi:hypothetical protein